MINNYKIRCKGTTFPPIFRIFAIKIKIIKIILATNGKNGDGIYLMVVALLVGILDIALILRN